MDDLSKEIEKWRNAGCEVILGLDANEDLSVEDSTSLRYQLRQVGLVEAILARHPLNPPATYHRNLQSQPIDGIFTSPGVPVLAGGYYEFDEFFTSDHRGLWIDFDLKVCLGGFRPEPSFQPRKLVSTDTAAVRRYLRSVQQGYLRDYLPQKLHALETQLASNGGIMSIAMMKSFNWIHKQAYAIRRKAESTCRKISAGTVPWSPKMQEFWDRLALWKILLKSRKKCRVSSRKVRRLMKKTGLLDAWSKSTEELEQALKAERKKYREAKRNNAATWRKEHLEVQLKSAKKKRWRSERTKARFQRLRRMRQREEARRRQRARGKGFSGGLRAIQVERISPSDGTVHLETITDRSLVEDGCRQENRARYDQTRAPYPTPPMQSPLYETFTGEEAEEFSIALMEGRYNPPAGLDIPTQQFLSQCRFPQNHRPVSMEVTYEDHINFWSKAPEHKGSEPHGLHNGHFKAALFHPWLARCDMAIRNIPITTGFVPIQWQNLMNFAIEKKAGDWRLSKMRTIQMMNSEFQANNKKMGRAAMRFAEKHDLIPPGQCGSRKRHQAIDLALSKRFVRIDSPSSGTDSPRPKRRSLLNRWAHIFTTLFNRFGRFYDICVVDEGKTLSSHHPPVNCRQALESEAPVFHNDDQNGADCDPNRWSCAISLSATLEENIRRGFKGNIGVTKPSADAMSRCRQGAERHRHCTPCNSKAKEGKNSHPVNHPVKTRFSIIGNPSRRAPLEDQTIPDQSFG